MYKTTKQAMVLTCSTSTRATLALLEELRVDPIVLGRKFLWVTQEIVEALEKKRRSGKARTTPARLKPVAWSTDMVLKAVHGDSQTRQ